MMEQEIEAFTFRSGFVNIREAVNCKGITRPFKHQNYFRSPSNPNCTIVIKLSRPPKTFWGLRKDILDFLDECPDYLVVLLQTEQSGWVYSRSEVHHKIASRSWRVAVDGSYKVSNSYLDDWKHFSSIQECLEMIKNLGRGADLTSDLAGKEEVRDLLEKLPEDVSLEDIQYHLYARQKIRKGIEQEADGKVIPPPEIERRMARWLR